MKRDSIPADELLRKAHAVGQYYGFTPLSTLTAKVRGAPKPKSEHPEALANIQLDPVGEAVIAFLKHGQAFNRVPSVRQPLYVWHSNIAAGRPAPKRAIVQFHALGTDRTLADAVVIRALIALIRDLFHKDPVVRINSMGDKETRARYTRELGVFFKRRAATLPEECVTCAKRDAFEAAELAIARACAEDLPAPTDHLSDMSRKRFEELLEFLEATGTPYELARDLISRGNLWSDTCFEITVEGTRVAWGSRYNDLTRHFFSTPMPAIGAVLHLSSDGPTVDKLPQPRARFAFVHIGEEAKRYSLLLAEEFKKARLPLTQDIGVESLTEQLALAERHNPPYLLIMGRKEALEHSVILRNRATQEEKILPLAGISERLRAVA